MDPLEEIQRHLDKSDDQILVILRCHLLVEERLRDIVAQASRAPEELEEARLSFYQVLCLSRAIIGRQQEPAWAFMKRLNEVRNKIAHHLEPGDLDELVGSLVEKLQSKGIATLDTPLKRLRVAALYVCGYLDAIRGSPGLRQAYTPRDST